MTVTVDPLPPPSDTPTGGDAPGGDSGTAGAPTGTALVSEWTESDSRTLTEIVRGPYDKIAEATHDPSYALAKLDEIMLVGSLSGWMPVSWVRASSHGQVPLLVAIPLTIGALVAVNLPRAVHWNRTHDEDEQIPIPFMRRRKGPRSDRPRPTEEAARPVERRPEPADLTGDRVPAPDVAPEPAGPGAVDGGPPADTVDSIRRAYAH